MRGGGGVLLRRLRNKEGERLQAMPNFGGGVGAPQASLTTSHLREPQIRRVADLVGHQGPVFEVAWAHPKFGNILASCGFDNRVILWQEQQSNEWTQVGKLSLPSIALISSLGALCTALCTGICTPLSARRCLSVVDLHSHSKGRRPQMRLHRTD